MFIIHAVLKIELLNVQLASDNFGVLKFELLSWIGDCDSCQLILPLLYLQYILGMVAHTHKHI